MRRGPWLLGAAVAPLAVLVLTTRLNAAAGDTIADRVLGQVDFVHRTDPSFIRKKSLACKAIREGMGSRSTSC